MSTPPHDVSLSAPPILLSPAAEAAASHDDIATTTTTALRHTSPATNADEWDAMTDTN